MEGGGPDVGVGAGVGVAHEAQIASAALVTLSVSSTAVHFSARHGDAAAINCEVELHWHSMSSILQLISEAALIMQSICWENND